MKLLRDLSKLDLLHDTLADGRQRILCVNCGAATLKFLTGNQTIAKKLDRSAEMVTRLKVQRGSACVGIGACGTHLHSTGRVELIDLLEIVPSLCPLGRRGHDPKRPSRTGA